MIWLLRLYPAWWRQRYGDEFLAMVEQRPLSAGAFLDIMRSALDAWRHPELASIPAPAGRGRSFDRFTPRARTALLLAEHESSRTLQPEISAEHLLMGLLLEGQGLAVQVLAQRGVWVVELRSALAASLVTGEQRDRQRVGLSNAAKRAIELGVHEANRLRHPYFGTEHLLLGLVAEGHSGAASLLRDRHVEDLSELRRDVHAVVSAGGPRVRPFPPLRRRWF